MDQPKVSVVILTKSRLDLLKNCVEQLSIKTDYPNYEIVVVDTGSDEKCLAETKNWINEQTHLDIQLYPVASYFFPENNNQAVEEFVSADSEYVMFLNNDCEVVNDVISIFVYFAQGHPNFGCLMPQLRNKDERIQSMGYEIEEYENGKCALVQKGFNSMETLFFSRALKTPVVTAVCMFTSREDFIDSGGFSSIYDEDYSDMEYSIKCLLQGKDNYVLGYALAIHYGRQTRGISPESTARANSNLFQQLVPFVEFYIDDLRDLGCVTYRDRSIQPKDWGLGSSYIIESDLITQNNPIFVDPFKGNNMEIQLQFEKRYGLTSDDGRLHVLMIGHKDGCGFARIDNPAWMINKTCQDIVAFPSAVLTPELLNWCHMVVWQVPVPSKMEKVRDFLNFHKIPQIFEVDDDYINLHKFNMARATTDPDSVLDWVSNTDLITVTRDSLGELYRELTRPDLKYATLPNCINFDRFPKTQYKPSKDGVFRLGWMGGATHYVDLEVIAPVLRRLKEHYGDKLEVCLFGWDGVLKPPFHTHRSVFGDMPITHINFVDVYQYYNRLSELKFDGVFIPLADITFNNKGKSPIKFLEASASRYPCVVSDSPVFDFLTDGVECLKAKTEEEWESKLVEFIESEDLRHMLSDNAFDLVFNDFNMEKRASEWAAVYRGVAAERFAEDIG